MGTWLGKGNDPRYTPTTTFETFPFPFVAGQEAKNLSPSLSPRGEGSKESDSPSPAVFGVSERELGGEVSAAAQALHAERDAWLHPSEKLSSKASAERTLTNLYNALDVWRGVSKGKVKDAAADFAPRLDVLHRNLDEAVCAAYGWPVEVLADEDAILRRLLALNAARAK
jgi:hypothetical protein